MSRYAIIIPATKNYLEEALTMVNSLKQNMFSKHPGQFDLYITTTGIEEETAVTPDDFKDLVDPNMFSLYVIPQERTDSEFRQVRTFRFKLAADIKDGYKAVCLLDADMCCFHDFRKFFKMAETGAILVCSDNTLLNYRAKDFRQMDVEVADDIDVVHPSFTTVPIFINPTIHEDYLMAIWNNSTGNDLSVPNLVMQAMGLMSEVHYLQSYTWTNIHHTMLKPETHVKFTKAGVYSYQGEPVYMLHGHWGDAAYVKELLNPMEKNYGWHPPFINLAKNCINDLQKEYAKYQITTLKED